MALIFSKQWNFEYLTDLDDKRQPWVPYSRLNLIHKGLGNIQFFRQLVLAVSLFDPLAIHNILELFHAITRSNYIAICNSCKLLHGALSFFLTHLLHRAIISYEVIR